MAVFFNSVCKDDVCCFCIADSQLMDDFNDGSFICWQTRAWSGACAGWVVGLSLAGLQFESVYMLVNTSVERSARWLGGRLVAVWASV